MLRFGVKFERFKTAHFTKADFTMNRGLLVGALVVGLTFHSPSFAQVVGQRVRVVTDDGKMIGEVRAVNATDLTLTLGEDATRNVAFANIKDLRYADGTRTYRKAAALIGAGVGIATGIGMGILFAESCDTTDPDVAPFLDSTCRVLDHAAAVTASFLYGLGGAVAGIVVGSFIKGDRWRTIDLSSRISLAPTLRYLPGQGVVGGVRLTL